jgi:outer membrane protein
MIAHAVVLSLALAGIPEAPTGELTIDHAVELARGNLPALRLARAQTAQARAQYDEVRGGWFPTASASLAYRRTTANVAFSPGVTPANARLPSPNADTYNSFTNSLTLTQLIWDFGQTENKLTAADENAGGQAEAERTALLQADFAVRSAFFAAAAQKALVTVAEVNLKNNDAHLEQTQAFVKAGTHPEIDLATAQANRANAVVQLITARNNFATAKTRLNQAMGVQGSTAYQVQVAPSSPVPDEDASLDKLFTEALSARPEEAVYQAQRRSLEATMRADHDSWFPSLLANAGASANGSTVDINHQQALNLAPNAYVGLGVSWSVNLGPYIPAEVRYAEAQLDQIDAQIDTLHLQVRVDVETAQLAVKAALESLVAAIDARDAANTQLRLAEGRYNAGVGNAVELGDAQLAADQAGAQAVQAQFNLDTARAQLIEALGRK